MEEHTHVERLVDEKIQEIKENKNVYQTGKVIKIKDYIIEVSGLEEVTFFEKVIILGKGMGYVNVIKENSVVVALVKKDAPIQIGDLVKATGEPFKAIFSEEALGRITDIFGNDRLIDKQFKNIKYIDIERKPVPLMDREAVQRPLLTGIAGIDLMYPIGKGQRQLIIGDKKTGKTQIAIDTIINQEKINGDSNNMICIYIAVGKTKKEIKRIHNELYKHSARRYTMMCVATNEEMPPVISLIPYVGLSIAEEFMYQGKDVLVVIDDLKKHAEAYRELSILSGKIPGREAYPSDIFYSHARMLEKGCQHKNGGSISILPITETKGGDITDYISTNIISITDGQIVLSEKQFNKGQKPAIDYGVSVSRLGGNVQTEQMKKIGTSIRRQLLQYLELKEVYELANMDDLGSAIKEKLEKGKEIQRLLNQPKASPLSTKTMLEMFGKLGEE